MNGHLAEFNVIKLEMIIIFAFAKKFLNLVDPSLLRNFEEIKIITNSVNKIHFLAHAANSLRNIQPVRKNQPMFFSFTLKKYLLQFDEFFNKFCKEAFKIK